VTASGRRNEANDVSLLWRHPSRSRSWQLERAYRRPFLTIFGEFEPRNVVGHRVYPKRHLLTSQRVFWAIVRQNPCAGHFSRRVVWKKIKNKKERPYISRISPCASLRPIGTILGLRARLVDLINFAKFYCNRLRGVDSVRGWIITIPIGLRCRR